MRLTVDGKTYEFELDRFDNWECMDIEKVTGLTFGEWGDALAKRSMLALTALVWIVRKREEPDLRFSDRERMRFNPAALFLEDDEDDAGKDEPAVDAASSGRGRSAYWSAGTT